MKINFDAIESRLKSLVESSSHLLSNHPVEDTRVSQLAEAVQTYLQKEAPSDQSTLPDNLVLEVPSGALIEWDGFSFDEILRSILQETGQSVIQLPQIMVRENPTLLKGEIRLRDARETSPSLDRTASMPALTPAEENFLGDALPENAYLIVNGLQTVQITQSVFNIGRRLENDLVIEDQRISREHAQIRAIKGQYVIFDLNSTGGTFVNSVRISQQPLYPGDVISLAGVPLVYGQDTAASASKTGPVEPFFTPSGEKKGQ